MIILNKIENAFNSLQERQKPIISDIITAKICDIMNELKITYRKYRFINNDIFLVYRTTGYIPTQKEIAQKHNRDEASISRSVRQFLSRIEIN